MKIEKVNDNQIRCTLTKDDLADRQLKISELAYGTDKAKSLFRDMMQQAAYEFGFEAEDIPLMIEAIPLSSDSIILIITKVEYPEELDTRFSKFAPSSYEEDSDSDTNSSSPSEGADDVLGLFKKIHDERLKAEAKKKENFSPLPDFIKKSSSEPTEEETTEDVSIPINLTKLYVFNQLNEVTKLADVLKGFYIGKNSLYKNDNISKYYLVVSKNQHSPEEFNKVCNILSEYGKQEKYTVATEAFLDEHLNPIIKEEALQVLSNL